MKFTVPGEPRGKQRPRFSRRTGTTYTPSETVAYEKEVRAEFLRAGGRKTDGPVALNITAYYKIPTSATKAEREKMLAGQLPQKKPDIDNVLKIIMDGLNGAAYKDDKQVAAAAASKAYDDEPHVEVEVSWTD